MAQAQPHLVLYRGSQGHCTPNPLVGAHQQAGIGHISGLRLSQALIEALLDSLSKKASNDTRFTQNGDLQPEIRPAQGFSQAGPCKAPDLDSSHALHISGKPLTRAVQGTQNHVEQPREAALMAHLLCTTNTY